MKKSFYLIVFFALFCLTACNAPHEHTFSEAWTCDETHHWHDSTCEHNGLRSDYGIHQWDSGSVIQNPSCTEKGTIEYTCSICKLKKTEDIPISHTKEEQYSTSATQHWYNCAICGQKISTTIENHSFSNHECVKCGYKEVVHSVSFEPNNGNTIPSQTVVDGNKATEPTSITKDHYRLEGWYKDSSFDESFSFTEAITEDVTLYAKWDYMEVTKNSAVYYPGLWATITWIDPIYEGFDHIELCPGGFEWAIPMGGGQQIAAGVQSYTITGTLSERYIFVCTVDSNGNRSSGIQITFD